MLSYVTTSGADIEKLVNKIERVIDGELNTNVSLACIVVAIFAQQPDIAPEKLQEVVKGMSEWLAAYLHGEGQVN